MVSGSAYGLVIGDSKQATFKKLRAVLLSDIADNAWVLMEVPSNAAIAAQTGVIEGALLVYKTFLHDETFEILEPRDAWKFYFDANYMNVLRLQFENDLLTEISRHRQKFELP